MSGFMNPDFFLFDHWDIEESDPFEVKFRLPHTDIAHVDPTTLDKRTAEQHALEFRHSFDDQIGGQLAAGLAVAGFYEACWNVRDTPHNRYMFTSTLAFKPDVGWAVDL